MPTQRDTDPLARPAPTVTALWFDERDFVPNNPRLPALVYEAAFAADTTDLAAAIEDRFTDNHWPPQWRDGIYDFHHYHSQGHEVLGMAAGHARLVLGGEGGLELEVHTGDVVVLPAGTGHCLVRASEDFLVIGGYPAGQSGDIRREAAPPALRQRMLRLSFPPSDPVAGADGPLVRHWADTLRPREF